jgi:hypothetical protein
MSAWPWRAGRWRHVRPSDRPRSTPVGSHPRGDARAGPGRTRGARQLLHDTTIDTEDRLAGLLLLLYAQRPTAIGLLTTDQITISDDSASISFGRTPIRLPHPVDELARSLVATRKGHATIGAASPSLWLFPGGQPGRPISTERLKLRLNRLGIRPNQARSTALFQLATEIPAAILARTLGISVNSAVRWQQISAGDWASYAADVSSRARPQRTEPTDRR